ncbi:MAG: gliding motility lipoprotein GldH [Cytophagales bacterium]|nr:MAG: gliding motility lipoprotein GldH [Cytophagales bacterium]
MVAKIINLIKNKWLAFLCTMLVLTSCQQSVVYEKVEEVNNKKWFADQPYTFQVNITDTTQKYDIYYLFENNLEYPFYNLYVKYYIIDPNQKTIDSTLQHTALVHPKTGEPYGEKAWFKNTFQHQLIALSKYKFKKTGIYTIKLKQYMRQNPLINLEKVGLRVEIHE